MILRSHVLAHVLARVLAPSLAFRFASFAAFALLAGCGSQGSGVPTVLCTPACPTGQTCTVSGCVAGDLGTAPDLSAAIDMANLCGLQVCSGTAPICKNGQCVICAVDTDCPMGQICIPTGTVTACVPGCNDDTRCAGLTTDGGAGSARCCNKQCVDTSSDPGNCGVCGMACMFGNGNAACAGGACTSGSCRPGWGDCNKNPLDGCETNLRSDASNCKACGTTCVYPNGIGGCSDGCYLAGCDFGFDDCNMDPSDGCETSTLADKKNCGSCGNACGARPHGSVDCINANCQLTKCDQGWSDCDGNPANGCETNTGIDLNNCGRCGNVCGNNQVCKNSSCTCMACNIPNAKTKCVNNVCVFDVCLPGYADCNFNLADGCETELDNDPNNCNGCGMKCVAPTPYCANSVCTAQKMMVGSFQVGQGPQWGGNPPCYTCQEACALKFGGNATDYACSTQMGMIDHMAQTTIWGVGGCAIAAEDFKKNVNYNCGFGNCAQSAYCADNCIGVQGTNYCFM